MVRLHRSQGRPSDGSIRNALIPLGVRRCTCQEARVRGKIVATAWYGQRREVVAGFYADNGRSATFDQGRGCGPSVLTSLANRGVMSSGFAEI